MLGVERDSMEQELVRAYHLERPDGLGLPPGIPAASMPRGDRATRNRLIADMNGIVMAQEMFYSTNAAYAANADSLAAKLSSGAELVLLAGDQRHWVVGGRHSLLRQVAPRPKIGPVVAGKTFR